MQEESPGCVFWHPKGWKMYNILKSYMRKRIEKDGYVEVNTPQMVDRVLWEKSGHWEKYRENMFIAESENRIVAIKPMNITGNSVIINPMQIQAMPSGRITTSKNSAPASIPRQAKYNDSPKARSIRFALRVT